MEIGCGSEDGVLDMEGFSPFAVERGTVGLVYSPESLFSVDAFALFLSVDGVGNRDGKGYKQTGVRRGESRQKEQEQGEQRAKSCCSIGGSR